MRDLSIADAVPKRSRELLRSRPLGTAEVFGTEVESFLEESTRAQRALDQEAWLRQTLEVQAGANKPPGTGAGRGQLFSQDAKGASSPCAPGRLGSQVKLLGLRLAVGGGVFANPPQRPRPYDVFGPQ